MDQEKTAKNWKRKALDMVVNNVSQIKVLERQQKQLAVSRARCIEDVYHWVSLVQGVLDEARAELLQDLEEKVEHCQETIEEIEDKQNFGTDSEVLRRAYNTGHSLGTFKNSEDNLHPSQSVEFVPEASLLDFLRTAGLGVLDFANNCTADFKLELVTRMGGLEAGSEVILGIISHSITYHRSAVDQLVVEVVHHQHQATQPLSFVVDSGNLGQRFCHKFRVLLPPSPGTVVTVKVTLDGRQVAGSPLRLPISEPSVVQSPGSNQEDDCKEKEKQEDDSKVKVKQEGSKAEEKQEGSKEEEKQEDSKAEEKQEDSKVEEKQEDSKVKEKREDTETVKPGGTVNQTGPTIPVSTRQPETSKPVPRPHTRTSTSPQNALGRLFRNTMEATLAFNRRKDLGRTLTSLPPLNPQSRAERVPSRQFRDGDQKKDSITNGKSEVIEKFSDLSITPNGDVGSNPVNIEEEMLKKLNSLDINSNISKRSPSKEKIEERSRRWRSTMQKIQDARGSPKKSIRTLSLLPLISKEGELVPTQEATLVSHLSGPVGLAMLPDNSLLVVCREGVVCKYDRQGRRMGSLQACRQLVSPTDILVLSKTKEVVVADIVGLLLWGQEGCSELGRSFTNHCLGLAEDQNGWIVTININNGEGKGSLTSPGNTDILYINPVTGRVVRRVEMVDIITDIVRSRCKSLAIHQGMLYVADEGLQCLYLLDLVNEGEEQVDLAGFPGYPASVVVDGVGNVLVADKESNKVLVLGKGGVLAGELVCQTGLSRPSGMFLDLVRRELLISCQGGREVRMVTLEAK